MSLIIDVFALFGNPYFKRNYDAREAGRLMPRSLSIPADRARWGCLAYLFPDSKANRFYKSDNILAGKICLAGCSA